MRPIDLRLAQLSHHKRTRDETESDTESSTNTLYDSEDYFDEDYDDTPGSKAFRDLKMAQALCSKTNNKEIQKRIRDVMSFNNLAALSAPKQVSEQVNSSSSRSLPRLQSEANFLSQPPKKRLATMRAIQTKPAISREGQRTSPLQTLEAMFKAHGMNLEKKSFTEEKDWVKWNTDGYTVELTRAIRDNDVETIRNITENGQNMQCSNQFGESVVHTAARRGVYESLNYLVTNAKVSVKVCCDSGRNPMHDSCWTGRPQFDCVKLLLRECRELLFYKDKRGFTPLEYVPRDAYPLWTAFLESNQEILLDTQRP